MARKPRIHFPRAFYHVMLCGNGGQNIFFSPEDQTHFCLLLQEGVVKFGHRIHAFCLMDNHIHLVVQVEDIPLAKIMQNLGFRYTNYINRSQNRNGHLFQGRYKAILIDADNYLIQLVRYIHRNPLRAKMVEQCKDFQWSSHNAYCGNEQIPWLTTDVVLSHFAPTLKTAQIQYMDFTAQSEIDEQNTMFQNGSHEGRMLGDDNFAEEVIGKTDEIFKKKITLKKIISAVCSEYKIKSANLAEAGKIRKFSEARALAALLTIETEYLTLTDLGKLFNREISGLSQGARRLQHRTLKDKNLADRLKRLRELLQL